MSIVYNNQITPRKQVLLSNAELPRAFAPPVEEAAAGAVLEDFASETGAVALGDLAVLSAWEPAFAVVAAWVFPEVSVK